MRRIAARRRKHGLPQDAAATVEITVGKSTIQVRIEAA